MIILNKKPKIAIIGLSGESVFMNVERFHEDGETIKAHNLHIEAGGKGYNQAIAVQRLGGEAHFFSVVGDDKYGHYCEETLKKEGVTTYFVYKANQKTAYANIITNGDGQNQVTVFNGAINSANVNDLNIFKSTIKQMDLLLLSLEMPYSIIKEAIKIANENNIRVILNPAPVLYNINELLDKVFILTPNEIEAQMIFNTSISNLNINQMQNTIITLGKKGALLIESQDTKLIKTNIVEVVDTTGAGDVFNGALSVMIAKGQSLKKAIVFANEAASISVTKKYVIEAIPYLKDLNINKK